VVWIPASVRVSPAIVGTSRLGKLPHLRVFCPGRALGTHGVRSPAQVAAASRDAHGRDPRTGDLGMAAEEHVQDPAGCVFEVGGFEA